jgi:thymidylate synthase
MIQITSKSAGIAWKDSLVNVLKNGKSVKDGDKKLKELLNVFLTVERPLDSDEVLTTFADPAMITWMRGNFLSNEPVLNWGYSYGQRFSNFDGINQIDKCIAKLKKNPEAKSATITLMDPKGDGHHMPCIVALDFKIRDGKLMTTAFFRSQDVGKKMYADIICLGEIAKKLADEVGVVPGNLHILIVSLHFYEEDANKVKNLLATS